jgi:hypothetical protein
LNLPNALLLLPAEVSGSTSRRSWRARRSEHECPKFDGRTYHPLFVTICLKDCANAKLQPKTMADTKEHAHELIERLAPRQVTAVVGLLEAMLDPVSRAIANAALDDEPETEPERQAVAESKAWFEQHGGQGISHEEVLADFGLTPDDYKKQKD